MADPAPASEAPTRADVVPIRRAVQQRYPDAVIAERFRALLAVMVEKALSEMGSNPFGQMIKPFLPMIHPVITRMPDEAALGILAFVKERLQYVEHG
jgi:hypothetical protein